MIGAKGKKKILHRGRTAPIMQEPFTQKPLKLPRRRLLWGDENLGDASKSPSDVKKTSRKKKPPSYSWRRTLKC